MKIELYPHIYLDENEVAAFNKVIDILEEAKKRLEDIPVAPENYHKVRDLIINLEEFYWENSLRKIFPQVLKKFFKKS